MKIASDLGSKVKTDIGAEMKAVKKVHPGVVIVELIVEFGH